MKIGILLCGHLEETLDQKHGSMFDMFSVLLQDNDFEFASFAVVDGEFPESVHTCDGWMVSGSVHGAYEHHEWIAPLEDFIRAAYNDGVPIVGICFGHQIMAQALGGKVEKYSGGWGIGHTVYQFNENQSQMALLAMHQDQVVEKPPQARLIAQTDFCANAGLAYQGNAISFQPHPEFTPEFMRDLIRHKIELGMPREQGEAAIALIQDENDSGSIAMQLVEFYKSIHASRSAAQAAE